MAGKELRVAIDGEHIPRIVSFWNECESGGDCDRLAGFAAANSVMGDVNFGICSDYASDWSAVTYMVAAETPEGADTGEFATRPISPATWAVFQSEGPMPGAIGSLWKLASEESLPDEYVHGDGPDVEVYPRANQTAPDYKCEIWIPVVPK